jgi:hypothetical protein
MKTFATTTFAFALLGLAACKGGGGDAAKFVPESATMLGGIDFAGIQGTQVWKDNKADFEKDSKDQLDAMAACNLGLDKWKAASFGMADGGKWAVVVVADGLGKKENIDCAHGKLKEKMGGNDPWVSEEEGKVLKNFMMSEGDMAYVVDDNTVAVASKEWAEDVKKLTKGEGKSALDGKLKDVIGRTDTGKHVWVAALADENMKGSAKELGDVGEPQDVAGWLDLSSGLELWASVNFKSGDDATKAKDAAQKKFDEMKPLAGQMGVPQTVIDSVKIDTKDSAVTVSAKMTDADAKTLKDKMPGM